MVAEQEDRLNVQEQALSQQLPHGQENERRIVSLETDLGRAEAEATDSGGSKWTLPCGPDNFRETHDLQRRRSKLEELVFRAQLISSGITSATIAHGQVRAQCRHSVQHRLDS